jgi:5-methylcytosine-specific restriction endonuclease McrA
MTCLNCHAITENPKFCSRSCAASFTNKQNPKRKTNKICRVADCCNVVSSCKKNYCDEHQHNSKKEKKQNILNTTLGEYRKKIKDNKLNYHMASLHAGIRGLARSWFKDLTKQPCKKCGYSLHVELCHIKAISLFSDDSLISEVNARENIVQLCPNCHWEFDNLPRQ